MVEAGFDAVRVFPRMVYVDSSRPDLIDGFTRKTFTAMIEGIRGAAIAARLTSRRASTQASEIFTERQRRTVCSAIHSSRAWATKGPTPESSTGPCVRWQQHVLSEGEAGSGSPKALVYFVCLGVFATE